MAGQLSVAAATTPAMRLRDLLGDLMWGIDASSIGDLGATRFSGEHSIAKKVARATDFEDTMRPRACLRSWHCGASLGLLRRYGKRARRVGKVACRG
jgi:hypothetical protein